MESNKKIERIAVYGVGGVGGYFGGQLANKINEQHDKEREIYFIGRGAHLQEIKKQGLTLKIADLTPLICKPTRAVESFDDVPTPDIILLAVKSYDLDQAVRQISKRIKENTVILPLLNGVDIYRRVRNILPIGHVFPACVYVFSSIEKPGTVIQKGTAGRIVFGKDPDRPDMVPQHVIDLFSYAGIRSKWVENISQEIWKKYLLIAPFALVTGCYGVTFGEIMEKQELQEMTRHVMEELIAIAKFEGVDFQDTIISDTLENARKLPYESKTSYQRDLEHKGKKNEGDLFGDTIIRLGKRYEVKTPITTELYTHIQRNL
jgi:2-dehydropantoate 2-reductase